MRLNAARESVGMALRSIRSSAGRSFLTTLGVLIGAGSLIALTALGNGASRAVEESLKSLGANLLIVYSGQVKGPALVRRSLSNIVPTLTAEDLKAIRGLALIRLAAPESSMNAQAKFENRNISASIVGTDWSYPEIRNFHPAVGEFFGESDVETRRMVAAIGSKVAIDLIGADLDPLGQRIRINGQPFTVVAVMQSKGNDTTDAQIFVPISSYLRSLSGGLRFAAIDVQAAGMATMREAQYAIQDELLRLHDQPSMDSADFYVANQLDVLGAAQGTANTFTILLGGIAAISLVVGGIGIMNIMLVSVTERTREIGVRMALGAKPGDVLLQLLVEAVVLSVSGGVLGIIAGVTASWAFSRFGGMAALVSAESIVLAFSFSLVTGLFFGGYPAYRASRLDPIAALRYE
jgi:putative ABC transport system permease protein